MHRRNFIAATGLSLIGLKILWNFSIRIQITNLILLKNKVLEPIPKISILL